jgi:hypothetical protein
MDSSSLVASAKSSIIWVVAQRPANGWIERFEAFAASLSPTVPKPASCHRLLVQAQRKKPAHCGFFNFSYGSAARKSSHVG